MQASSLPPCLCSLLSGCASPMAPVLLHSQCPHLLGYKSYCQSQECCNPDLGDGILLPVPAQYQPFSIAGCRSSLSHPLLTSVRHQTSVKLFLPEVALPPPGPDVGHVLLPQHALHPIILRPGLDADGVHAELPSQK